MRARAPGKVVLSGAYAVLEGAPALVTAVDRYVIADSKTEATFEAPEARAAIPEGPLPHIDVSALRKDDRKLGLGSSAAIVVASLAALLLEQEPDLGSQQLAPRIWQPALIAHRKAQGGGSGIDVVTSAFGGTRRCQVRDGNLHHEDHSLPQGLFIELYAARESTSTRSMISLIRTFAQRNPEEHQRTMKALGEASEQAATAVERQKFIEAIVEQRILLARLGDRSGAPIVPKSLRSIADRAFVDGVAVHPSGAGGGDIVLCMGPKDACMGWRQPLETLGLEHLDIAVGAPGVHPF